MLLKLKIMKVCILGSGLTSLTLAKALVKENIYVDILEIKQTINQMNQELLEYLKVTLIFLTIISLILIKLYGI